MLKFCKPPPPPDKCLRFVYELSGYGFESRCWRFLICPVTALSKNKLVDGVPPPITQHLTKYGDSKYHDNGDVIFPIPTQLQFLVQY